MDWGSAATSAQSTASGTFTIDPAPAGDLDVQCDRDLVVSGGTVATSVASGQTANVELLAIRRAPERVGSAFARAGFRFDRWRFANRIGSVNPGGAAAAAGLAAGDIFIRVNDVPTDGLSVDAIFQLLADHPAGTTVAVTVSRAGTAQAGTLTLQASSP